MISFETQILERIKFDQRHAMSLILLVVLSLLGVCNFCAADFTTVWGTKVHCIKGIRFANRLNTIGSRKPPTLNSFDDCSNVVLDLSSSSRGVRQSYSRRSFNQKDQNRGKQTFIHQIVNQLRPSLLGSVSHYHGIAQRKLNCEVIEASVKTKKRKKLKIPHSVPPNMIIDKPITKDSIEIESPNAEAKIQEAEEWVIDGVTQPLIPIEIWEGENNVMTGEELYGEVAMESLAKTCIQMAEDSDHLVDWKPADKVTSAAMEEESSQSNLPDEMLKEGKILVWTGKFKSLGYGSDLPVVKTKSVLPLSPISFSELLMDSSKIKLYNKISLGRTDEKILFKNECSEEAKIVRNISKPPVSKRKLEFFTFMHSRRLHPGDVRKGILGGGVASNVSEDGSTNGDIGYLVVSRAVNGGVWSEKRSFAETKSSDQSSSGDDNADGSESDKPLRCEILLGVNVIRSIPGHPNKCEVTAITHVKSAKVPKILATKLGVSGAINFINDIRDLYQNDNNK